MAERSVTKSGKNREGDITSLCGTWGEETKDTVIRQLEASIHRYYVEEEQPAVDVHVVIKSGEKYLRTTADASSNNNLDNLPDC